MEIEPTPTIECKNCKVLFESNKILKHLAQTKRENSKIKCYFQYTEDEVKNLQYEAKLRAVEKKKKLNERYYDQNKKYIRTVQEDYYSKNRLEILRKKSKDYQKNKETSARKMREKYQSTDKKEWKSKKIESKKKQLIHERKLSYEQDMEENIKDLRHRILNNFSKYPKAHCKKIYDNLREKGMTEEMGNIFIQWNEEMDKKHKEMEQELENLLSRLSEVTGDGHLYESHNWDPSGKDGYFACPYFRQDEHLMEKLISTNYCVFRKYLDEEEKIMDAKLKEYCTFVKKQIGIQYDKKSLCKAQNISNEDRSQQNLERFHKQLEDHIENHQKQKEEKRSKNSNHETEKLSEHYGKIINGKPRNRFGRRRWGKKVGHEVGHKSKTSLNSLTGELERVFIPIKFGIPEDPDNADEHYDMIIELLESEQKNTVTIPAIYSRRIGKKYECPKCRILFDGDTLLGFHLGEYDPGSCKKFVSVKYECTKCNCILASRVDYFFHYWEVCAINPKNFLVCNKCSKKFPSKQDVEKYHLPYCHGY